MHILPDLKEIEKEFSVEDGLVVVSKIIDLEAYFFKSML